MKPLFPKSLCFVVLSLSMSCATTRKPIKPLETVAQVDKRYLGLWYEIARFPMMWQDDCFAVTALYTARADGKIDVLNSCHKKSFEGPLNEIRGLAELTNPPQNSKLKVTFFDIFTSEYWIVDLGLNYEYAVMGSPDREYLWILSRKPTLSDESYARIITRLQAQEYSLSRLQRTPQR